MIYVPSATRVSAVKSQHPTTDALSKVRSTPLRPRRWFQFRLQTLLILVVALSAAAGWVTRERRKVAARREFFRMIDASVISERDHPQPQWRRWLFGDDTLYDCDELIAASPLVDDETIAHILSLDQLRSLDLGGSSITDASLARLGSLKNLVLLSVSNTSITGIGMSQWTSMPELVEINFNESRITDGSLRYLNYAPNLKSVSVNCTAISDDGIRTIARLPQLV